MKKTAFIITISLLIALIANNTVQAATSYTVQIDNTDGYLSSYIGTGRYMEGTKARIRAKMIDGKEFRCWYQKNGTVYTRLDPAVFKQNFYSVIDSNKTYCIGTDFDIEYRNCEGAVNTNKTTYNGNEETYQLSEPTRVAYEFTGWTGSNGNIKQKTVTIAQGEYGDKVYTANWSPITYTISYDLKGGTLTGSNPSQYTAESEPITLINPRKTGFDFAGWTSADNEQLRLSEIISKGTYGDKEYTANWYDVVTLRLSGTIAEIEKIVTISPDGREREYTEITSSTDIVCYAGEKIKLYHAPTRMWGYRDDDGYHSTMRPLETCEISVPETPSTESAVIQVERFSQYDDLNLMSTYTNGWIKDEGVKIDVGKMSEDD